MGRYTGRSSRLFLMCILTFLLFVLELTVGYIGNSLSLSSDAFAVLSHLISMIIGLLGVRVSRIRWHKNSTFGFPRADVVGAFGNSVFATALMLSILIEAVKRYLNPQKTDKALLVLIVGVIGLFFNVLNYVVFMDCCYCHGTIDQDMETGSCCKDSPGINPFPALGSLLELARTALQIPLVSSEPSKKECDVYAAMACTLPSVKEDPICSALKLYYSFCFL